MAEIHLKNVRKQFGEVAVIHGIDLEVRDGEFVVLVGPSGCGKSTLLRIMAGLERVTEGQVLIDERDVSQVPASDRGLAMVFQSYALYPHMSVYKNMAFGLENTKMPRAEIETRVRNAAGMLQITELLGRKPRALSGGQRQRVAIGRAIVREPKAFLFDEPLSNLDAELRVTMRKELAALHASIGGTMVYVTHDQVEAMTLADRIVVLNGGKVEQIGSPLELYNTPRNAFVAGFIGSPRMNLLDATVQANDAEGLTLALGAHRVRVPGIEGLTVGQALRIGVRPEHLEPVEGDDSDLPVTVDLVEQLGGETYLYCTGEGLAPITVHRPGQLAAVRGAALRLKLDRARLHLFDASGERVAAASTPGNVRPPV